MVINASWEPFIYLLFFSLTIHLLLFYHFTFSGVVRAELKNNTFYDLGIFDDGPYEVGDENLKDKNLVPVPANSYLGRTKYLW